MKVKGAKINKKINQLKYHQNKHENINIYCIQVGDPIIGLPLLSFLNILLLIL
jgi:hypothetical protein